MGEIAIDEARELVSNGALWSRVRDFLWDFAPQIHETWRKEAFDKLGQSPTAAVETLAGSPRVKREILGALGVEPCFHSFPQQDWSRLLLLDGAMLLEIAKWLGALASADKLRKITDGAKVRELKAALPGVYPDVFAYTMYFKGTVSGDGEQVAEKSEEIARTGVRMLMEFLSEVPKPLYERGKLKLPKPLVEGIGVKEDVKPSINLKLLLKLKFPEAHKLCCS